MTDTRRDTVSSYPIADELKTLRERVQQLEIENGKLYDMMVEAKAHREIFRKALRIARDAMDVGAEEIREVLDDNP